VTARGELAGAGPADARDGHQAADAQQASLARHLGAWLHRDQAVTDLRTYFHDPQAGTAGFTGRWFERLGGGGDGPGKADWITAEDLIAVQMLSVQVPPETAAGLLHGRLGRQLHERLPRIPTDVALSQPEAADLLTDDADAAHAWNILEQAPGVGWVTAGKLLARKRPHLIPVYDRVVRCGLGSPNSFWTTLQRVLDEERSALTARLAQLREEASVASLISDLRILDVVVWMGHRHHHSDPYCPLPGERSL
jgi:hypothetical protein